jgi:hypothetical protein
LRGIDLHLARELDQCAAEIAELVQRAEAICSRLRPTEGPGQLTVEALRRNVASIGFEVEGLGLRIATLFDIATAVAVRDGATEPIGRFRDHATGRMALMFDLGHGRQERLELWVANGQIGFNDTDRVRIQAELRKAHEVELLRRASAYERGIEAGSGLNAVGTIDQSVADRIQAAAERLARPSRQDQAACLRALHGLPPAMPTDEVPEPHILEAWAKYLSDNPSTIGQFKVPCPTPTTLKGALVDAAVARELLRRAGWTLDGGVYRTPVVLDQQATCTGDEQ